MKCNYNEHIYKRCGKHSQVFYCTKCGYSIHVTLLNQVEKTSLLNRFLIKIKHIPKNYWR